MLMKEPTEEFIKECKEIYDKNKNNLEPNKKEGLEIADYLKEKYSIIEIENRKFEKIVDYNIDRKTI